VGVAVAGASRSEFSEVRTLSLARLTLRRDSFKEARAWLRGKSAPPEDFAIRYTDVLKRTAVVSRKSGAEEHWQYLYDCWRNTDETAKSDTAP
jgi:hypothetical protein